MTTLRTRLARTAAVVALVLGAGLALAAPAGAEAGPGYPPAPGDDTVVEAGPAADEGPTDTRIGDAAQVERPADEAADAGGQGGDDEEAAVDDASATGSGAPRNPSDRGLGPVLVIVVAAGVLGGAVVAIARRI